MSSPNKKLAESLKELRLHLSELSFTHQSKGLRSIRNKTRRRAVIVL